MKKLIRILGLAAGVVAVVWLTRDRLLPTPSVSTQEPPAFRHHEPTPPPAATPPDKSVAPATAAADDLTAIKGIGPVRAGHFTEAGITTFAALAAADPATIADELDVSESAAAGWVAEAASRAG